MGDYASYKDPITVKGLPGDIQINDGADDLTACHTASIKCNPDGTSVLSSTYFVGDGSLLTNLTVPPLPDVIDAGNDAGTRTIRVDKGFKLVSPSGVTLFEIL